MARTDDGIFSKVVMSLHTAGFPLHWINSELNVYIPLLYFSRASFVALLNSEIPGCQTPSPLQGKWTNLGSAIPFSYCVSI